MISRDAIAGSPDEAGWRNTPALLELDDNRPLKTWEPWVRDTVIDAETQQGLGYRKQGSTGFELYHLAHTAQGCAETSVVTLHRPSSMLPAAMQRQVTLVLEYADLRPDRLTEILSQIPQLLSYWVSVAGLHASRTPRTLEILGAAVRLAILVEMRFKHAFAVPRPVQFSPQVQPPILTPSHSAFPSGHSTEAHCAAGVLMAISKQGPGTPLGDMLLRLAGRIAINRTVAGVHFPIDSRAGQVLGACLAEYVQGRATGKARVRHRIFDASDSLQEDFLGYPLHNAEKTDDKGLGTVAKAATVPKSALLASVWEEAQNEWPA